MRAILLTAVLISSIASSAHASAGTRIPWANWAHTRPLSAGAITLLEEASERSLIVTNLLNDLEQTDLVVYVTDAMTGMGTGPTSYLTFVSHENGKRYLLVRIDFWRLSPPERIAWLGHELQHALEVAAAPDVTDAAALMDLYRHIGWASGDGRFESRLAQDTGNRVRSQLDSPRAVSTAGVTQQSSPRKGLIP